MKKTSSTATSGGQQKKTDLWKEMAVSFLHTGSRVICTPAPKGSDDDWLVKVDPERVDKYEAMLAATGFNRGGSFYYDKHKLQSLLEFPPFEKSDTEKELKELRERCFHSWKRDDLNVIVTISPEYFANFVKATSLARMLNIQDKPRRIMLFECVCYDVWPL